MQASAIKANAAAVSKALRTVADRERAVMVARYFKTGKGEYGEGDIFIGVKVPDSRSIAKRFRSLPLSEVEKLLRSKIHEERLVGALVLVLKYADRKADERERENVFRLYVKNLKHINNWDLVDTSAEHIIGRHLRVRDRALLDKLVRSKNLWLRRVAIMSTFHFIRQREFEETLRIAEILLSDEHDLIHKAVGWMIREVGNRDLATAERFLKQHAPRMPRTMLRYAIERFPKAKRVLYLTSTRQKPASKQKRAATARRKTTGD